ncbi:hypothetical protein PMALA_029410 [Plasmodium malariae]|uniref:CCAAT-binding factor domain-containing protein n=1 Tax=Plasmodium malariae TaxID=5858 RepID=A0A1A8WBE3_PLAMA|nr:hypothetical protein PMALA_029410 [Plasmodium malariae]
MKQHECSFSSTSLVINEICSLFSVLQNAKSKKCILNSLTRLFVLLYSERMKRKLIYDDANGSSDSNNSNDGTSSDQSEQNSCDEDNIKLKKFFKKDFIILETRNKKKVFTKYDKWLNECFEKFLSLLFQLLSHDDELFLKKSLSLLFGCLQLESKIYESVIDNIPNCSVDNVDRNNNDVSTRRPEEHTSSIEYNEKEKKQKEKSFPIKLFRRITVYLLKMQNLSISAIKHICKSYLCFYYDLNYFFLSIFKIYCMDRKNARDGNTCDGIIDCANSSRSSSSSGSAISNNSGLILGRKGKRVPKAERIAQKVEDTTVDNDNTSSFIYSILINSIKPDKKVQSFHIKKSAFMKKGKIDDMFLFLDEKDKRMTRKRKYKNPKKGENGQNYNSNRSGNNSYKKSKMFCSYESDDTIVHSSSDSSSSDSNESSNDKIGSNKHSSDGDYNFLRSGNLTNGSNSSDEETMSDVVEQYDDMIIQKRRKEKNECQMKERKNNLFININIDNKIYARLYANCWFYFITTYNHKYTMMLQLLHFIPLYVFPYTNNPYYLIDFFNYAFYSASNLYVSLAALPGIFHILTELNIGNLLTERNCSTVNSQGRTKEKTEANEDRERNENYEIKHEEEHQCTEEADRHYAIGDTILRNEESEKIIKKKNNKVLDDITYDEEKELICVEHIEEGNASSGNYSKKGDDDMHTIDEDGIEGSSNDRSIDKSAFQSLEYDSSMKGSDCHSLGYDSNMDGSECHSLGYDGNIDNSEYQNHGDELDGEKKLNDNMYTDYYKRLFELIMPVSFYYDGTSFLKIIYTSIKNRMIPLYYVISFLKKLLRVGCLTSYNISINILSVVYDILNYFKNELHDAMFISAPVFMNMEFKNDFFCFENLEKNFDKNKIIEMLEQNAKLLNVRYIQEEKKDTKCHEILSNVKIENKDDCILVLEKSNTKLDEFNRMSTEDSSTERDGNEPNRREKNLFSLQSCLPDKYQINMNTLNKKELYMANHIFYEIILLNNHICDNLRYYSNVYYYSVNNDSSYKPHEFYNDPNKMNWEKEDSLLSFLKNILSFKKKRESDICLSVQQKNFSTIFL